MGRPGEKEVMTKPRTLEQPLDPNLPDAELAHRVAAGSEPAFRALMRRYNQKLFRTARSILRDDAEAEDALQDAYMAAYRAMPGFRGDAKLSTWLTRIVVNESLARLRKSRRGAQVIPLDGDADAALTIAEKRMSEESPNPTERDAIGEQSRRLIEAQIDQLPDVFRTVFVMRAVEEMTVEEVAACLEIPEATVRTRFFRARALMREALAREADRAVETAFSFAGERCDRIVERVIVEFRKTRSLQG
jgi:RNA polymerase sigma-70 factor (ECF subfamily)